MESWEEETERETHHDVNVSVCGTPVSLSDPWRELYHLRFSLLGAKGKDPERASEDLGLSRSFASH